MHLSFSSSLVVAVKLTKHWLGAAYTFVHCGWHQFKKLVFVLIVCRRTHVSDITLSWQWRKYKIDFLWLTTRVHSSGRQSLWHSGSDALSLRQPLPRDGSAENDIILFIGIRILSRWCSLKHLDVSDMRNQCALLVPWKLCKMCPRSNSCLTQWNLD